MPCPWGQQPDTPAPRVGCAVNNFRFLSDSRRTEHIGYHGGAGDVPRKVQTLGNTRVKSFRSRFAGNLFRMYRKSFGKLRIEAFQGHTDKILRYRAPILHEG